METEIPGKSLGAQGVSLQWQRGFPGNGLLSLEHSVPSCSGLGKSVQVGQPVS